MSNLTEHLRVWRENRNIIDANYRVYFANVVEELLEPLYSKKQIKEKQEEIMMLFYPKYLKTSSEHDVIDAIQDIQVFSINETELMGYDNNKCNKEVFKEIDSRLQCPNQYSDWLKNGAVGKWKKWSGQKEETLYKADYESCKMKDKDKADLFLEKNK